jgi:hypothetical protein
MARVGTIAGVFRGHLRQVGGDEFQRLMIDRASDGGSHRAPFSESGRPIQRGCAKAGFDTDKSGGAGTSISGGERETYRVHFESCFGAAPDFVSEYYNDQPDTQWRNDDRGPRRADRATP